MGGSGDITKYRINLDLIEIIETPPPMGGWMGGSVGQWVGSGHITKYQIKLKLFEIIEFCLKIYHLWRHHHL